MSSEFSPKQALVLWKLIITEEEPMISKVQPDLSPAERRRLVQAGLIRLEKRGRASHIVLEDKAWDWAVDNFDVELSVSKYAVPVLEKLLIKLRAYLHNHQVSLAEILAASEEDNPLSQPASESLEAANSADLSEEDVIKKIRQTYVSIPDGEAGYRVRLYQLREHLPEISKQRINQALLSMQARGEMSLLAAEYLKEINTDDEAAAIDMGGGDKRYFAYMKR